MTATPRDTQDRAQSFAVKRKILYFIGVLLSRRKIYGYGEAAYIEPSGTRGNSPPAPADRDSTAGSDRAAVAMASHRLKDTEPLAGNAGTLFRDLWHLS